jgi:hypothetical protein
LFQSLQAESGLSQVPRRLPKKSAAIFQVPHERYIKYEVNTLCSGVSYMGDTEMDELAFRKCFISDCYDKGFFSNPTTLLLELHRYKKKHNLECIEVENTVSREARLEGADRSVLCEIPWNESQLLAILTTILKTFT